VALSVGLTEAIRQNGTTLTAQINLSLLLPVKAGVVGVIAAALLSFWGYFWTEVNAPETRIQDVPSTVLAYRRTFAYLVPTMLLLFLSLAFDFYLLVVGGRSQSPLQASFGAFGAALIMLLAFALDFSIRTLLNMDDLLLAGKAHDANSADDP
jgi:hypothetical protein